jgi:hypothetical protein
MLKLFLQHKQDDHRDQSRVIAGGLPLPGLILRHPDMALGILNGALDTEALRLHAREFYDSSRRRGGAQVIIGGAG